MTAPLQVRLPIGPLLALTDRHVAPDRAVNALGPIGVLAQWSGLPQPTIHRWQRRGSIPFYSADKVALAVGCHPAEVWGMDWWSASYDQSLLERTPKQKRADDAERKRQSRARVERRELVVAYSRVEGAHPHTCAVDGCECEAVA